jgi:hypothetical protein
MVVAAGALLQAAAVLAMDVRSCEEPRVFRDTPVNVLLLPYTYTGAEQRRPLSEAARLLGILMEQDSLIEMVKYGSIAVVNLVSLPGQRPCVPDEVWERMVGAKRDRASGARPGAGVAMMWGRLYEQGTDLYIQSYLRFARVDTHERVQRTAGSGDARVQFGADLPQSITLPPRRISEADLRAIAREFTRAAKVYEQPSESARVVDALPDPNRAAADPNRFEPFGYIVTEVRGDWMRTEMLYGGRPGWVRARVDANQWPLRDRLPEMHMLDAVVGYLHYRVATEPSPFRRAEPPLRVIDLAQRSLARYLERTPADVQPAAAATGQALLGTLHLLAAFNDAQLAAAEGQLAAAERLAPYSGELRNLHNLARLQRCCLHGARDTAAAQPMMDALLDAIAADPENANALRNLLAFHLVLGQWPDGAEAIGSAELERQRAAFRSARITP